MSDKNPNYSDCVEFMKNQNIRTIADWNKTREEAKGLFTKTVINRLDASGLVSKLVKKVKL